MQEFFWHDPIDQLYLLRTYDIFWTNDYEMLSIAAPAACTPATETATAPEDGQRRGSLSLPEIRE